MNVTRRFFLKSSAALAATYCGVNPARLLAEVGLDPDNLLTVHKNKTLVAVFLRGGMDGLNFVVPLQGPGLLQALRKNIALAESGQARRPDRPRRLLRAAPARRRAGKPLFGTGDRPSRSRRSAMTATPARTSRSRTPGKPGVSGNTLSSDGWLNRHLLTSQGHGPIRAVSIGDTLPRILRGKAPGVRRARHHRPGPLPGRTTRAIDATGQGAHRRRPGTRLLLRPAHRRRREGGARGPAPRCPATKASARDLLSRRPRTPPSTASSNSRPSPAGPTPRRRRTPRADFGRKLEQVARLIKSGIGLEVVEVDYGGWDTHQNQGGAGNEGGGYGNLVGGLAEGLAAFCRRSGKPSRRRAGRHPERFRAHRRRERHRRDGPRLGELHVRHGRPDPRRESQRRAPRHRSLARNHRRAVTRKARPAAHHGFPRRARRTRRHPPG